MIIREGIKSGLSGFKQEYLLVFKHLVKCRLSFIFQNTVNANAKLFVSLLERGFVDYKETDLLEFSKLYVSEGSTETIVHVTAIIKTCMWL